MKRRIGETEKRRIKTQESRIKKKMHGCMNEQSAERQKIKE
jgi:hypothetical protein